MNWYDFAAAVALLLIFEGCYPFLNPGGFRRAMAVIQQLDDRTLRIIGLLCLLCGVVILSLIQ